MKKVIYRMTESELKSIVNESVRRILKEENDELMLQMIAQAISNSNESVYVNNIHDTNEYEIEFNKGEVAHIEFNVESNPYWKQGMSSSSYDVPNDDDEVIDEPKVHISGIWVSQGDDFIEIQDNGIVANAMEGNLEINYDDSDFDDGVDPLDNEYDRTYNDF